MQQIIRLFFTDSAQIFCFLMLCTCFLVNQIKIKRVLTKVENAVQEKQKKAIKVLDLYEEKIMVSTLKCGLKELEADSYIDLLEKALNELEDDTKSVG